MILQTCAFCDNEFSSIRKHKFCSHKCFCLSVTQQRIYQCKFCEKEFTPKYKKQMYCSHSCATSFSNLGRVPSWKIPIESRCNWIEVQDYYNQGHTIRGCLKHFSITGGTEVFSEATKAGLFKARKINWLELLTIDSKVNRTNLKKWLIDNKILKEECEICQQSPVWRGTRLPLILDHRNGINDDYRIENLRLLCPNCNAQQPTFAGRNMKNPLRKCKPGYKRKREYSLVESPSLQN